MNRCLFRIAAVSVLLSCVSESTPEKETGLPGSWMLRDLSITAGVKRIEFICFGKSGGFNSFAMASEDTVAMVPLTAMRRIRGSWLQTGDSLKITQSAIGHFGDTNGIGEDWPQKIEMKASTNRSAFKIRLDMDTLFLPGSDAEYRLAERRAPHERIKRFCPE